MKLQQPYGRYKMSLFSDFVVRRLVSQIWASIVVTVLLWHCLNFISCIVQYVIRDRDMDLIRSLIIMQSVSPFQFPTDKKKKKPYHQSCKTLQLCVAIWKTAAASHACHSSHEVGRDAYLRSNCMQLERKARRDFFFFCLCKTGSSSGWRLNFFRSSRQLPLSRECSDHH